VRGRDAVGNWGNASGFEAQVNSSDAVLDARVPVAFALYQSVPNPFGRQAAIRFDVPRAGNVLLEIYDVNGRRVRTLADGAMAPGARLLSWDGTDAGGRAVGSGVYFYRLRAEGFEAKRKLTLLR
jgi:hypothetical protein